MALVNLSNSIPEWQALLDGLNDKITRRQKELAEADNGGLPTHPIRRRGSTESLRPNDDGLAIQMDVPVDVSDANTSPLNTDAPLSATAPAQNPNSTQPPEISSPSQTPQPANHLNDSSLAPPVARKRKNASLVSAESGNSKHRTRTMTVVYYDSTVQTTFEELVRHISTSRNSMRRGTMSARMASMRRMADLELFSGEPKLDVDDYPSTTTNGALNGSGCGNDLIASATPGDVDDDGTPLPALNFVSTRRMGPMRGVSTSRSHRVSAGKAGGKNTCQAGLGSPSRRSATGSTIFDELDNALEWCQATCEHAAHQFLRDGQCSSQVEGIKSRLKEVLEKVEQEVKRERDEAETSADIGPGQTTDGSADSIKVDDVPVAAPAMPKPEPQPLPARTMKQIQIRRTVDKMADKRERLSEKPATTGRRTENPVHRSVDKVREKPMHGGIGWDTTAAEKGSGIISIDIAKVLDKALEVDGDVMDEDNLRNEYADIIARNKNYRRHQRIY